MMMGILSGNPHQEPMHYGEVFAVWSYLTKCNACIAGYQTLVNHCGDKDLKEMLQDLIKTAQQEKKQTEDILKENGIALPPAPPERPAANAEAIPAGARVMDPEIAAMIALDNAAGLVACSQAMGQCVREDIAAMFGQFHVTKAQYGLRILRLNKEKGWLIVPPLHVQTPEPVQV
jgi:hypothetical protein